MVLTGGTQTAMTGKKSAQSNGRLNRAMARLFADKEIILRSEGTVRFLRISRTMQIGAASMALISVTGLGIAVVTIAGDHSRLSRQQQSLDADARSVATEARKIAAYKQSVKELAEELEQRQDVLDDIVRSQFSTETGPTETGAEAPRNIPGAGAGGNGQAGRPLSNADTVGMQKLRALEDRQSRFALSLAHLAERQAGEAAAAIRSFGLKPEQIVRANRSAQGGPYMPWPKEEMKGNPAFSRLADALAHLNALENGLMAIPSGKPTSAPMLSSSYGYRRDPFNGHAAFHAGVDFPGHHRQPILAAAAGRILYAGYRDGYGKVIEVDHGHGIMTRYAHLAGFADHNGKQIKRGDIIGYMGSTGRSTGTHLHFEVRMHDRPINPRPFLEAGEEALKIQNIAKERATSKRKLSAIEG